MALIIFNGKSTEDLCLISQAIPSYEFPKKLYNYTHIPGRNGDIVIDTNAYENVNRTYYLASIYKPGTDFASNASKIVEWLMSAKGYCRLEDSYEPDVYRMASYVNNGSLTDIMKTATTINVTFNCKPQRYLKAGEKEVSFGGNANITITNPTEFDALPTIKFTPTVIGKVTITLNNDYEISINVQENMLNKVFVVDSETQNCYYINGNGKFVNANNYVTLPEDNNIFPVLSAGQTTVSIVGGDVVNKSITPRWWKL